MESFQLKIGANSGDCVICAIGALEDIHRNYGFHVLRRTLKLCVAAWEGDKHSLSGNILKGIARLIVTYGDAMIDDYFIEKMGHFSVREIARSARERDGGTKGYAEAILSAYNKKIKNQLDPTELNRTNRKSSPHNADVV